MNTPITLEAHWGDKVRDYMWDNRLTPDRACVLAALGVVLAGMVVLAL